MKRLKYGKHNLEMYDSPRELTMDRYQLYSLNLMIDSGIGGDVESVAQKTKDWVKLSEAKRAIELNNLYQCLNLIVTKSHPKFKSFIVLIHKIDGRVIKDEDLTDLGISDIQKELSKKGFIVSAAEKFLLHFKKKVDSELELFSIEQSKKNREYFFKLRQRASVLLDFVNGDFKEKMNEIDNFIFSLYSPEIYSGANGLEVEMISKYNETKLILTKNGVIDAGKLNVLEFYQALKLLKNG